MTGQLRGSDPPPVLSERVSGVASKSAPISANGKPAAARKRHMPEEVGIFAVLVVVATRPEHHFAIVPDGEQRLRAPGQRRGHHVLGAGTGVRLADWRHRSVDRRQHRHDRGDRGAAHASSDCPGRSPLCSLWLRRRCLGLINGSLTHFLRIPAFIATFSTQGVALAVPLIITGAQSISVHDFGFSWIGQGRVVGIPTPVVLIVAAAVIAGLFLRMTRLGVHIYALGGNKAAARLAGVNVAKTTLFVYAVSGFCAGMGGLIATSRLMVGFPATGTGNELFYSIAAAVVGGVSLFGGVGSILGAMIGAVLIAVVSNGMNVINVQSYWQSLVIGVIILLGVTFDTYRRARKNKPVFRKASPELPAARRRRGRPAPPSSSVSTDQVKPEISA